VSATGSRERGRPGSRLAVWLGIALALALLPGFRPGFAQDASVRAQADRTRVDEGGQVVLTIEISAANLGDVAPPDVSGIVDFDIVGGPMSSSRFQWINGRTSATKSFAYVLRPRKIGSLTIPPLGLLVGGKTYRTGSIEVEAIPGGGGSPGQRGMPPAQVQRGGPGQPSGPGQFGGAGRLGPPGRAQTPAEPAPQVTVVADVDTRTAYLGQQITLRVLLDTQTEILNLGMKDTPTFPGFWTEEIKLPENLEMRRVQRGTEVYNEYTLMKRALFPTGSGALTVPAMTYQIQVRRRSQDPIESFFFTPTETITRRTEPITIRVETLPVASRPPDFSGAVGNFTLTVNADRKETRVNDAIGIKVKIAGEGNLNAVSSPPLAELSDFKEYAPKVTSSSSVVGERLRGEKTWDYVLIPLAAGAQTIPPVSFSFFDPRAGQYRTVSSGAIPIQVARAADGSVGTGGTFVSQSDVRQLRKDIHFIKQAGDGLADRSRLFYRAPLFMALLVLPVVANLGVYVFTRRRESLHANARQRRERKARSQARRRLKDARRRLSPSTSRAFYAEVARALTEYVAAKFDAAAAGLTHDRIEELLASRGSADEDRREFHRCLEACDYARFAPTSSDDKEMRRSLHAAEEILVRLERSLSA